MLSSVVPILFDLSSINPSKKMTLMLPLGYPSFSPDSVDSSSNNEWSGIACFMLEEVAYMLPIGRVGSK